MPLFDLDSGWLWKDTMETKSAARDDVSVMTAMVMMLFVQKIEKDDLKQRSFMGFAHFWLFQANFLGIPFNINCDRKDSRFKECMYKGYWNSSVLVRTATFFVHCTWWKRQTQYWWKTWKLGIHDSLVLSLQFMCSVPRNVILLSNEP